MSVRKSHRRNHPSSVRHQSLREQLLRLAFVDLEQAPKLIEKHLARVFCLHCVIHNTKAVQTFLNLRLN